MKIRLLSDIHLETGPFTWQDQGEDVVVLAGDIGVGTQGIEWAKSITKPVIYVAGNHEHWGQADLEENIAAMRKAARRSNVHFLERDSVVLEVGGEEVHFLGCTLWTSYCGESRNMFLAALEGSRDYGKIRAPGWNKRNARRLKAFCRRHHLYEPSQEWGDADNVHPAMLLDLHRRSVAWLERQLDGFRMSEIPTVVVSHHAPSMQSLLRARMVSPVDISRYDRIRYRSEEAMHMAAYASDLDSLIKRYSRLLAFWLHGHTHEPLDYALNNVRVVCNPRGYHEPLQTKRDMQVAALFGIAMSAESIARDQADFAENPERGSVYNFERHKVLDLTDGLVPCLVPQARECIKDLLPIAEELRAIAAHPGLEDPALRMLFLRGLRHAARACYVVTEDIALNKNSTDGIDLDYVGRFTLEETSYTSNYGRVDIPVPRIVDALINEIGHAVEYYGGDGYARHVAGLWDRFNKHWIHA